MKINPYRFVGKLMDVWPIWFLLGILQGAAWAAEMPWLVVALVFGGLLLLGAIETLFRFRGWLHNRAELWDRARNLR